MRKHFKNKCRCTVITLLFCIFSLFIFSTIVYSAFSSTMNINGVGFSRVEADVRITDFSIKDTTNNSISMYESFGKDFISSEVSLKSNSSITYNLEITNYGSVDVGIYSIIGIPEGVNYSIDGYNLKDKICDDSGKCNNYAVKTYSLKIYTTGSSYDGVVNFQFNFRKFHKITYTGFTGNYIDCVMDGDSINIDLSFDSPKTVLVDGIIDDNYSFVNNILSLYYVTGDISVLYISEFYNYNYTGAVQEFIAPVSGIYKIELWGASGNDGLEYDAYTSTDGFVEVVGIGGYGGYTSGQISLEKGQKLYVYVGEKGKRNLKQTFNGGGTGGTGGTGQQGTGAVLDIFAGYSGGGATDVRLVSGVWNDINSLRSRIMVAAGGGGATIDLYSGAGGQSYAGGINGYSGGYYHDHTYVSQEGKGGTQTLGGAAGNNHYGASGGIEVGKFGIGGNTYAISSAAGAGGGGGGTLSDGSGQGGGGGSSYISGHEGCTAVSSSYTASNTSFLNSSVHYSGYRFYDTKMIDGKGYSWTSSIGSSVVGMPTFDGNSTMTGNLNNGYAKITLLEYGELLNVSYGGIVGDYISRIPINAKLSVDFKENAPERIKVLFDGVETNDYNYENGILTINKVLGNVLIQAVSYDFSATLDGYPVMAAAGIEAIISFDDTVPENFPIKANFYLKYSSEDDSAYQLVYSDVITDNSDYYYSDYAVDMYESYDLKVVLESNDGVTKTYYSTIYTECFVSGTKVLVEDGYRNIEDIKVGDYVYALDLDTNERVLKKVTRKYEGSTIETYEVTVNGEKIMTTPKHEFYVIDKGWVRAFDLKVGDVLNSFNNGKLEITDIKYVKHEKPVKVYNMTIEGLHNYLISSDQLLVHNGASFV